MKIATGIGIGQNAVQEVVKILGYVKICAHWLPCLLKKDKKCQRRKVYSVYGRVPCRSLRIYSQDHDG
jgi:hypothetical protein